MSLPEDTKSLLDKYGLHANRVLGQNFLINEGAVSSLITKARIGAEDTVVEVGPGLGTITARLAEACGRVIAVEKDPSMVEVLRMELAAYKNIEIIHGDILEFNPKSYKLAAQSYKLIGAPPYYLTARLFRAFLEGTPDVPSSMALIIQKEVAEKVVSAPPRANMLSVAVQLYGAPSLAVSVGRGSFSPQPNVDSAILLVEDIKKPPVDEKMLFGVIRAGFSSPRKQLGVNIANAFHIPRSEADAWLDKNEVDPTRRAQTLSVEEWVRLAGSAGAPSS